MVTFAGPRMGSTVPALESVPQFAGEPLTARTHPPYRSGGIDYIHTSRPPPTGRPPSPPETSQRRSLHGLAPRRRPRQPPPSEEQLMADLSRRALLGLLGAGALGPVASIPRLTAADIPGRRSAALNVAILGTAQDAASRQALVRAFTEQHPDIPVRIQAIQGADWSNFFAKILTMVAAGTPPDVCVVATEGAQLFAERLAHPLDDFVGVTPPTCRTTSATSTRLVESFMYQGSLFQLPMDFNAANVYYNTGA